jgi:phosphate transport system substrate-binding protein
MKKTTLLMGASALVAASLGLTGGASAQVTAQVYGGGGSLIAPTLRQALDCYANPTGLVIENSTAGPPVDGTPATVKPIQLAFHYTGTTKPTPYNCASIAAGGNGPLNPTQQFNYISSGSGAGGATFFSHDTVTYWNDTQGGATPVPYPNVQFGESDAGLATSDVAVYDTGGIAPNFKNVAIPGVNCTGSCLSSPLLAAQNPYSAFGQVIQLPLLVTPVTLAFDPTYKKVYDANGNLVASYQFNIKKPNADGSGGLVLSMTTVCGIWTGAITTWADSRITADNGGKSLQDPNDHGTEFATLPIEMVGRFDSSGTSSIFTRALAAQCSGQSIYTVGTLKLPSAIQNTSGTKGQVGTPGFTPQVGLVSLASNSSGVAGYIAFTATPGATGSQVTELSGKLGYLSPDYVWPAVQFSGANNGYHLDLVNVKPIGGTTAIEPTVANTLLGFKGILPPESSTAGAYIPNGVTGSSGGSRAAPDQWVFPVTIANNPLAFPANVKAYPILGTTQAFFYTCYNENPNVTTNTGGGNTAAGVAGLSAKIRAFLTNYYTSGITIDAKASVLAKGGFVPMPKAWETAIIQTYLTPTTKGTYPTNKLNLNILPGETAGAGGIGTQCAGVVGA